MMDPRKTSLKLLEHDDIDEEEHKLREVFENLAETVIPLPAFCIKTQTCEVESLLNESITSVYINVCTSDVIPPPPRVSSDRLKRILSYRGDETEDVDTLDNFSYKIPVSVSEAKFEKGATIYDVCMHPDILPLCNTIEDYKLLVTELAMEWVEERYSLHLDRSK
jgi:hypothetical protein